MSKHFKNSVFVILAFSIFGVGLYFEWRTYLLRQDNRTLIQEIINNLRRSETMLRLTNEQLEQMNNTLKNLDF